jgi:prepilin-type N-terminal cleavage/methylation domain-containing protein/prepilin-type processing-associated H-X9-DG protein
MEEIMSFRSVSRKPAFTLIELLVVVAIIALLIAILVPTLGRARSKARTAHCLANIRGMTSATAFYIAENSRPIPFYNMAADPGKITAWTQILNRPENRFGITVKNRLCQEAKDPSTTNASTSPWYGSAHFAWGNTPETGNDPITLKPLTASYAYNGYLYRSMPDGSAVNWINTDNNTANRCFTFPISRGEAEIPVFADGVWRHIFPLPTDTPGADLENPGPDDMAHHPLRKIVINRHNKAVNVSFFDGHAETVPLSKLWSLRWSKDWVIPASPPAIPNR